MLKLVFASVLLSAVFAHAAPAPSKIVDAIPVNANVCVLLLTQGENGLIAARMYSCDGDQGKELAPVSKHALGEISGQVAKFYAIGLRLINCQVNTNGYAQYVCTMAR